MPRSDYIHVTSAQPHVSRSRRLLAAHPEVRSLMGPTAVTAPCIVGLVLLQFALAWWAGSEPWWIWFPLAYIVGATIDHALWVLIHECSHNLVMPWTAANRVMALVANLPIVFPGALAFAKYHMLHHTNLGEMDFDADVPNLAEARLVRSAPAKALWLAGFAAVQGLVRTTRLTRVRFMDGWIAANFAVQVLATVAIVMGAGWGPLVYLLVSSIFAIGLHPLGARWIQEHFVFADGQETYSYYGPLNKVCFNMGYHNEHHDLMTVPWINLPRLKAAAPEFYEPLYAHRSWTKLLIRFITDSNCSLYDRTVRPSR